MLLARTLWREGYNDHLAGHITISLGRRDAAVQSVVAHVGRDPPVRRHHDRPRRQRPGGRLAGAAGHPVASRVAPRPRRRAGRDAQPSALRHGVGRHARGSTGVGPELQPRWRRLGARRRIRWLGGQFRRRRQDRGRDGRVRIWRCSPATVCSCSARRSGQSTSVRSRSSSAAATRGTCGPPAEFWTRRCQTWFSERFRRSDGDGFRGFWEAMVRAELRADPTLLNDTPPGVQSC